MDMNRRTFLSYMGTGAAALAAASTGFGLLVNDKVEAAADHLFGFETNRVSGHFDPIVASSADELLIPAQFEYDVVAVYGDVINAAGDTFGHNADFNCFFPIDGSATRGLLFTNHEATNIFVLGKQEGGKWSKDQVNKMLYNQGASVIEIVQDEKGVWSVDKTSQHARRINGFSSFEFTGPARGAEAIGNQQVTQGTFANCSGGMTLWNTVLSCEENFSETAAAAGLNSTHYGWVIEVDPFDGSYLKKHTALGRFNHENTAMGLTKDGRIVVYEGDDKKDACIYKFISKGYYDPAKGRSNASLLEEGTLYVADLKKGVWVALTAEAVQAKLKDEKFALPSAVKGTKADWLEKFKNQGGVVTFCQEAALIMGGTPTDRPEDIEISPFDNTVFIAHTNNDNHGNIHGHITRIFEKGDDLGALEFDFEIFAAGGRQSGFSSPDNLIFDSSGSLWIVTDITGSGIGKGVYKTFLNNGLFVVPTSGPSKGKALQFASAPKDSELTGPWFTPDERTLFLSIQHPGENTTDLAKPTSMWPHRKGDTMPRCGVVAIRGFRFK